MNKLELKAARIFLIIFGVFHLLLGILGSISPPLFFKLIYLIWNANINPSPIISLTSRFFFAYMIGSGIMILILLKDIRKYRQFLIASMSGIFIEFIQSIIFFKDIAYQLNIQVGFMALNVAALFMLSVIFLIIYVRTK